MFLQNNWGHERLRGPLRNFFDLRRENNFASTCIPSNPSTTSKAHRLALIWFSRFRTFFAFLPLFVSDLSFISETFFLTNPKHPQGSLYNHELFSSNHLHKAFIENEEIKGRINFFIL